MINYSVHSIITRAAGGYDRVAALSIIRPSCTCSLNIEGKVVCKRFDRIINLIHPIVISLIPSSQNILGKSSFKYKEQVGVLCVIYKSFDFNRDT